MDGTRLEATARAMLHSLDTREPAERIADLDMAAAYRVAGRVRALREARGERVVGRKIGFTNTTIWPLYGVDGPMWNYVWDTTVANLADDPSVRVGRMGEPRIEPEIVFGLAAAPEPGMSPEALLGCVEWVAHGFEVVQSVFPGWRFSGPESAAGFGLHGALRIGVRHAVAGERGGWGERLAEFSVTLSRDGAAVASGHARDVLGGPVRALGFLVEELARHSGSPPLAAGEIVTTGTLTDAQPIRPGETWETALTGLPISGIRLNVSE